MKKTGPGDQFEKKTFKVPFKTPNGARWRVVYTDDNGITSSTVVWALNPEEAKQHVKLNYGEPKLAEFIGE